MPDYERLYDRASQVLESIAGLIESAASEDVPITGALLEVQELIEENKELLP